MRKKVRVIPGTEPIEFVPGSAFRYFRFKVGGDNWPDDLVAEITRLLILGMIENARVLAQRHGHSYIIMLDFESEEQAKRCVENFGQVHKLLKDEPAPPSRKGFIPWGRVFPKGVAEDVILGLSSDPVAIDQHVENVIKRDEERPSGDYVFAVPDEEKEEFLKRKGRRN
ncbi:MAG: hypothetical protein WAO35_28145 [Terriglobia bacterium]